MIEAATALQPLRDHPAETAIFTDVDGTIAPIVERPEDAAVLPEAAALLVELAALYDLVACVSGRRAADARRLVGIGSIIYVGNHGLERLLPGETEPRSNPSLDGHETDAAKFAATWNAAELESLGLRVEDKGAIQALHWRGSPDEEDAEALAHEIAADAEWRGLFAGWGRKVLEVRPPVRVGKGGALTQLVHEHGIRRALYAGDDRTDLDGFAALHRLREAGQLDSAVCIGVLSAEGPGQLAADSDVTVDGPQGLTELLQALV